MSEPENDVSLAIAMDYLQREVTEQHARAERAEALVRTLVEAANKSVTVLMRDTLATAENGLIELDIAIEQARAALPKEEQEYA